MSRTNKLSAGAIPKRESLQDYHPCPNLGREEDLLIVVKHQGQYQANQRFLRFLRSGPSKVPPRRSLRAGMVFLVRAAADQISKQDVECAPFLLLGKEPRAVSSKGSRLVIATADELVIFDWNSRQMIRCRNPKFADLHSVFFSDDGRRLLVAATGFDTILELDTTSGETLWCWSAWEHGWIAAPNGSVLVQNPAVARQLRRQGKQVILLDPQEFTLRHRHSLRGLPTRSRPCHLNGAVYSHDNQILASLFHQGQLLSIDRSSGHSEVRYTGLANPHGLTPNVGRGYIVTDTHRGNFLFLSPKLELLQEVGVTGLPGVVSGMEDAGEWLQYVTQLKSDLYAAADIRRSAIHLFKTKTRQYRTLKIPGSWGVQMVMRAPAGLSISCRTQAIVLDCRSNLGKRRNESGQAGS
jgi:hypothetical protein